MTSSRGTMLLALVVAPLLGCAAVYLLLDRIQPSTAFGAMGILGVGGAAAGAISFAAAQRSGKSGWAFGLASAVWTPVLAVLLFLSFLILACPDEGCWT